MMEEESDINNGCFWGQIMLLDFSQWPLDLNNLPKCDRLVRVLQFSLADTVAVWVCFLKAGKFVEEMLTLLPLKGQTHGEDIQSALTFFL